MINSRIKPLVAEFIGTFALVFIGVLSVAGIHIAGAAESMSNLTSTGLAHGLTIAVMIAALGGISGGHFNPAVTLAFLVARRVTVKRAAGYWLAQLIASVIASVIVAAAFGPATVAGATPSLAIDVAPLAGIVLEALAIFFLVLVIFGTALDDRAKTYAPFAIGLTIALGMMAIAPITGGAINPARAFGPALVSKHWDSQYVYWIGGLLGGPLAALLSQWLWAKPKKKDDAIVITLAKSDVKDDVEAERQGVSVN